MNCPKYRLTIPAELAPESSILRIAGEMNDIPYLVVSEVISLREGIHKDRRVKARPGVVILVPANIPESGDILCIPGEMLVEVEFSLDQLIDFVRRESARLFHKDVDIT